MKLSLKAQIVLKIFELLNAKDIEHKIHIYDFMDKLDKIDLKELMPEVEEYEIECIRCEMTQKSISTTIASLIRNGKLNKTESNATKVGNIMRNVRSYYLA